MSTQHQILCINKGDRPNIHERITHVGGKNPNGNRWRLSQTEAIDSIEKGERTFWVSVDGKPVDVIVAESRYGHKYIKTKPDDDLPNNLLNLPDCPV